MESYPRPTPGRISDVVGVGIRRRRFESLVVNSQLSAACAMHKTLLLLFLLAITTSVRAQTQPMLMGLTRTSPLLAHIDMNSCAVQTCLAPLSAAVLPYAGDTAHDGMTGLTWVSNGTTVTVVDP